MANYSKFLSLINGVARQIDLSVNTLEISALQLDGATSGSLTHQANATTTSYTLIWPAAQSSGAKVLQNDGAGNLSWVSSSAGSVTSVALADGSSTPIYSISGSPVTSTGTLTFTLNTQSANSVFAGPASGSAAQPGFRSLVVNDIPSLSSLYLALTGGTMSGAINMGSNKITNLAAGSASSDAANIGQVVLVSGANAFTGNQSMGSNKLTNLAPGTAGTDAINLNQLQNYASGVQWRPEVNLYDNVDTTLPATTATTIDGVTVTNGMRVLFVNLSSNNNEVYTAAVTGVNIVWTAALDNDRTSAAPVTGDSILVIQGTTWGESAWNYNGTSWVQFNGAGQIQAGTALSKSGNTLNVLVDNSTIDVNGSNQLEVKAAGITSTQLASGSVTTAKLGTITDGVTLDQSGAGSTLEIKTAGVGTTQLANSSVTAAKLGSVTDGVTLDQSGAGSTIEIKSAGVSATQLATGAFDQVTITGGAGTPASVASSPAVKKVLVAGQSFAANTSYAVRWGITANGETSGRIYAADITTSSFDLFYVIGMASSATSVTAGQTITVTERGAFNLSSSDTAFGSNTDGAAVFLTASGTFSLTAPSSSGQAITRIGVVQVRSATVGSNIIDVDPQVVGVN